MISGNQTWWTQLQSGQKRPLYIFVIPDLGLTLTSFSTTPQTGVLSDIGVLPLSPQVVVIPPFGYGVILYGVGAYGT